MVCEAFVLEKNTTFNEERCLAESLKKTVRLHGGNQLLATLQRQSRIRPSSEELIRVIKSHQNDETGPFLYER